MPIKTKSGKWRWGNIVRDNKKELAQAVYGVWKKNGSKGDFGKFFKSGKISENEHSFNFKKIDFPINEISALKSREHDCLPIYTTRVSNDFLRFHKGDIVVVPWQSMYIVADEMTINDVKDHPFFKELSLDQIMSLQKFDQMKLLKLERISNNDGIEFKSISDSKARELIDNFESYTNNERLDLNRLYEPFSKEQQMQKHIWYGCFKNDQCVAISLLKKIPKGFILLAEFQSVVKGYGKILLNDILSKSKNIWWCADPEGGESLADYYRQFGLEEHLIKMSKWTNTPEYAFFKVSDEIHRQQILNQLAKADMTDEKYTSRKM